MLRKGALRSAPVDSLADPPTCAASLLLPNYDLGETFFAAGQYSTRTVRLASLRRYALKLFSRLRSMVASTVVAPQKYGFPTFSPLGFNDLAGRVTYSRSSPPITKRWTRGSDGRDALPLAILKSGAAVMDLPRHPFVFRSWRVGRLRNSVPPRTDRPQPRPTQQSSKSVKSLTQSRQDRDGLVR